MPSRIMSVRVGLLCAIALAGACTASQEDEPAVVFHDSAGITIVEHRDPPDSNFAFTASTEPTLKIGVADGDSLYELSGVRGATLLSDGSVAIALYTSRLLVRIFDSSGRYIDAIARRGDGPGELPAVSFIRADAGDTLVVATSRKVIRFLRTGEAVDEVAAAFTDFNGRMKGGTLAGTRQTPVRSSDGISRTLYHVRFQFADGSSDSTAAGMTSNHVLSTGLVTTPAWTTLAAADARDSVALVNDANNSIGELRLFNHMGRHIRSIRLGFQPLGVTEEMRQEYRTAHADLGDATDRPRREREAAELIFPARVPHVWAARIGTDGRFWAQRYNRPGDRSSIAWYAFSPSGQFQGALRLPYSFVAYEFGPDYLLGKVRDEDGVEYVVKHSLTFAKPGG